jgi:hypothetical protein
MMFRYAYLVATAAAADVSEDSISLLQLRASKREDTDLLPAEQQAGEGDGFCGLGILTDLDSEFRMLPGRTCGSGGDCDSDNDALIGPDGARSLAASRDDVSACQTLCEGSAICDGFSFRVEGANGQGQCYFRKDAKCGLKDSPERDCYNKQVAGTTTLGTLVAKFEARCEAAKDPNSGLELYSTVLCEQLRQTLAQDLNLEESIDSGGDGPQKLCAELKRLTQAHFDHESDDVDQAVQAKDTVVPCDANVDCNGHGSTADNDSKDGCVCECLDGWTGSSCSEEPQEATTTVDAGKAIDDPHLTSVHGTKFDLYTSGKYTLLSVPRHASGSDADLIVTAYVEKIGERKNDLWIRRMSVSGKWVGDHYSFKTSSGSFGSEGTHLVRIGSGHWMSPVDAHKQKPAAFRVLPHRKQDAPEDDYSQSISDRVELECGPVTALIRWATVQKNGEDVNHIDFRMSGLHNLGSNVGGLLADEFDAE